ncbi:MAG: carboxypeptidase regulatory-like domain-containing protein, partial [Nitrospinaceae bacterium]|nr:carboxypeptidase regulatory-like domain-containing protein [Nitrospinaceae bacterium]NIR56913.1 carboxypeptidase regulatory-like domain-containing protein [Nitrospinaceae bacterium]NIS87375.1 carboxypeptidase regulatory-like domain-containing protein [Nitrospinaceae bacterium]NIT84230.1 carboxypeptidase regulatory-like domain-containing protein [Nitrospinaceae bacterium]NIU46415.1 carboxypeptidase regulatory-like domain-containing protein [Nitrospinaceae bacterium]
MKKLWAGTLIVAVILFATSGYGGKVKYTGGPVTDGGTLRGVVHYDGPLKDIPIPVKIEKNGEYCSRHPDTKNGVRIDHKITVTEGRLKDAVVFIEEITAGKEWSAGSAGAEGGSTGLSHFRFKNCEIVPKVSVIRQTRKGEKRGNLTVDTVDKDVLHNPIGYLVDGSRRKILFNKPLSADRDFVDATRSLKRLKKKKGTHFLMQCGQHNYVEADARIVWNPYYYVTGPDGAYQLDQVPAGQYRV